MNGSKASAWTARPRDSVCRETIFFYPVTLLAGLPTLRSFSPKVAPSLVVFSRQSGGQSPARAAMDDDVLAAQLEDYRKALVGINEDVRLCAHASTRSSPARLTSPPFPVVPISRAARQGAGGV